MCAGCYALISVVSLRSYNALVVRHQQVDKRVRALRGTTASVERSSEDAGQRLYRYGRALQRQEEEFEQAKLAYAEALVVLHSAYSWLLY